MDVVYSIKENHICQLHELYQKEWWTQGRSLQQTRELVAGSQLVVGLVDDQDMLVASARVLTDFICKAFIFDCIVREDHRGQGLGGRLILLTQAHESLKNVRHIELYCLPDVAEFYSRHGFTTDVGGLHLMRQKSAICSDTTH